MASTLGTGGAKARAHSRRPCTTQKFMLRIAQSIVMNAAYRISCALSNISTQKINNLKLFGLQTWEAHQGVTLRSTAAKSASMNLPMSHMMICLSC